MTSKILINPGGVSYSTLDACSVTVRYKFAYWYSLPEWEMCKFFKSFCGDGTDRLAIDFINIH